MARRHQRHAASVAVGTSGRAGIRVLAGHHQRLQFAGADVRQQRRRRGDGEVHRAGQQVVEGRAGAPVGNMDHIGFCQVLQQLGGHMLQRAIAAGGVGLPGRIGLDVFQELSKRAGRKVARTTRSCGASIRWPMGLRLVAGSNPATGWISGVMLW